MIRELSNQLSFKGIKNFLIYGFGQSFNLLSPLVVAPYIIKTCNLDGFGKVGLGFALSLFLILIVDYAFDIKGTKNVAENRDNVSALERILSITILTKIVLFVAAFIIGTLLILFVPFFDGEKKLFFLSIFIVFAQVFNPIWFFQGLEDFKLVSIINVFSKTIYIVLVFAFINQKADYVLVNFLLGFSALICNLAGLIVVKIKYNFNFIKTDFKSVKTIIKKDFTFCMSQLFLSTRQLSPLLLCGFFFGYSTSGLYKILEQVITLFRTFIQVYLKYFFPRACYKIKENLENGFTYWKKYIVVNFVVVVFALIILFIFSIPILKFFNVESSDLYLLDYAFKIALIVPLLMAISLYLEQLMFITNKNKVYIIIAIFVTIMNTLLILVFLNYFNMVGIIIAIAISEVLFIALYYNKSYLELNKTIKKLKL